MGKSIQKWRVFMEKSRMWISLKLQQELLFFSVTRNWDARRLDDFAKKLALNPIVDCHESGWLWGQVSGWNWDGCWIWNGHPLSNGEWPFLGMFPTDSIDTQQTWGYDCKRMDTPPTPSNSTFPQYQSVPRHFWCIRGTFFLAKLNYPYNPNTVAFHNPHENQVPSGKLTWRTGKSPF